MDQDSQNLGASGRHPVALVWIYAGPNPSERIRALGSGAGQGIEIIVVGGSDVRRAAEALLTADSAVSVRIAKSESLSSILAALPREIQSIVFWVDDGKPVRPGFALEMGRSILPAGDRKAHLLHYWDGTALAMSTAVIRALTLEDRVPPCGSLLAMLSGVVGREVRKSGSRVRLAFSPVGKYAAMGGESLGAAS